MPLDCPHCQTEQADDARSCLRCGLPLRSAAFRFAGPTESPESGRVSPSPDPTRPAPAPPAALWEKPAVPALIVAALLSVGVLLVARANHWTPASRASVPSRALESPLFPPPSTPLPVLPTAALKVDCFRAQGSAPVPAGSPLMFTAVVYAPPGRPVTLALSSHKERGPSVRFSLAQGRLCSVAWTPVVPGRYQLTATAWDGLSHASASRSLWVRVVPAPPAALLPLPPAPVLPVPVAARPSGPVDLSLPPAPYAPPLPTFPSAPRPVRDQAALPPPEAVQPVPMTPASPAPMPPLPPVPKPPAVVPPALYHVVAASFPYSRSAFVLAKAFRARGLPATVRRGPDRQGHAVYFVETGSFRQAEAARTAAEALRHSGYPAYSLPAP